MLEVGRVLVGRVLEVGRALEVGRRIEVGRGLKVCWDDNTSVLAVTIEGNESNKTSVTVIAVTLLNTRYA